MKEIIVYCPDDFTDKQVEFIKQSVEKQIEAEISGKASEDLSQKIHESLVEAINALKTSIGELNKTLPVEEENVNTETTWAVQPAQSVE